MGTKANPAPNDCYLKAEDDEPLFTLLARDPLAPQLVRRWVALRIAERVGFMPVGTDHCRWVLADGASRLGGEEVTKLTEALECADAMEAWAEEHRP